MFAMAPFDLLGCLYVGLPWLAGLLGRPGCLLSWFLVWVACCLAWLGVNFHGGENGGSVGRWGASTFPLLVAPVPVTVFYACNSKYTVH